MELGEAKLGFIGFIYSNVGYWLVWGYTIVSPDSKLIIQCSLGKVFMVKWLAQIWKVLALGDARRVWGKLGGCTISHEWEPDPRQGQKYIKAGSWEQRSTCLSPAKWLCVTLLQVKLCAVKQRAGNCPISSSVRDPQICVKGWTAARSGVMMFDVSPNCWTVGFPSQTSGRGISCRYAFVALLD